MIIRIIRTYIRKRTTDGRLIINGQHICDTEEATPTLLPAGTYKISVFKCPRNKRQIPLVTDDIEYRDTDEKCNDCIIYGREIEGIQTTEYEQLALSPFPETARKEIRNYEQQVDAETRNMKGNIHPRYCPRITHGNGAYNIRDGSIIVGKRIVPGCVIHSRTHFDHLFDRIEKAISRGGEVQLVIS